VDESAKRDYLFYLSIGHTRLKVTKTEFTTLLVEFCWFHIIMPFDLSVVALLVALLLCKHNDSSTAVILSFIIQLYLSRMLMLITFSYKMK